MIGRENGMPGIQERGSTHVYKVNKISKEEIDSMVARCVYEEPPFCNAACPLQKGPAALGESDTVSADPVDGL